MRLAINPATQPLQITPVHRTAAAEWVVYAVTLFGALSWGLVGAFDLDPIAALFGAGSVMARLAYLFVACCAAVTVASLVRRSAVD